MSGQAGQRGSLWVRTQVCHCAAPRALTGLGVRTSAGNVETLRGCAACAKHASMYTRGAERLCVCTLTPVHKTWVRLSGFEMNRLQRNPPFAAPQAEP